MGVQMQGSILAKWANGPSRLLKGAILDRQHQMYNIQIMDNFYYKYCHIITINLFSNEARNMNQVWITFENYNIICVHS